MINDTLDNIQAIEHDKLMRKIFHIGIKSTKNMMSALAANYKDRLPGCKVINKYDYLIVKYCGFEFKVDPRINMCLTGHPFAASMSRVPSK
jgi:hypothetical protein